MTYLNRITNMFDLFLAIKRKYVYLLNEIFRKKCERCQKETIKKKKLE